MLASLPVDAPAAQSAAAPPEDPPAYVYAAADIRPRQAREIELCTKAAQFDWMYTGAAFIGLVSGIYANTQHLKQAEEPGVRLVAPAWIGFSWGMLLSGGYLSLPKCDPTWAYGPPPEGNVRSPWPVAVAIAMVAGATAPAMDYAFLGPVKQEWMVWERSTRVFVGIGTGVLGAVFPYIVSPRPWAAKKEIERIRLGAQAGGPFVSYTLAF